MAVEREMEREVERKAAVALGDIAVALGVAGDIAAINVVVVVGCTGGLARCKRYTRHILREL